MNQESRKNVRANGIRHVHDSCFLIHDSPEGFTLLEMLIVVAILGLLSALIVSGLSSYRESAVLDQAADEAFEFLRVARSQTLGSEGGSGYGVHFDTLNGRFILFRYFIDAGGTLVYNNPAESTNTVVSLPSVVEIPDFAFIGTTTDNVYFERLTGETKAAGLVTFRSKRSGKTRAVEIFSSGAIRKL